MCPESFVNLAPDTRVENSSAALKSSRPGCPYGKVFWLSETTFLLQGRKPGYLALAFSSIEWVVWKLELAS